MAPIPTLTPSQKRYQAAVQKLTQPPESWPSYLASPFKFILSPFQKKTGKLFLDSIKKLTKKKVLVNFDASWLQDVLNDFDNSSQVPLLFYIQKNGFLGNGLIVENFFCDAEIAAFVNVNFLVFGVGEGSGEMDLA